MAGIALSKKFWSEFENVEVCASTDTAHFTISFYTNTSVQQNNSEEQEDGLLAMEALKESDGISWDELKRKHGL
jgi:hypothetical protein